MRVTAVLKPGGHDDGVLLEGALDRALEREAPRAQRPTLLISSRAPDSRSISAWTAERVHNRPGICSAVVLGGLPGQHPHERDGKAALVGVIVEVRGRRSGRLRLHVLSDASQTTLGPWVSTTVDAGAIVHTDAWDGYGKLRALGFDHPALAA